MLRPPLRRLPSLAPALALLLVACGDPPAPAPAAGERPGPGWGEVAGGLQLKLDLGAATGGDGTLVATVVARNAGDAPLRLHAFDDQMWWYRVTFESLGEGPDFVAGSGLFLEFETPPDVTLPPGTQWERKGVLTEESRRFLRIVPNRRPGDDWDYRDRLPPGRYRAFLDYAHPIGGAEPGTWTGTARSNVLEITIAGED